MKLDGWNGLDVLRVLRNVDERAIVILVTAFPDVEEAVRAGATMDAAACLKKPFEIDELIGVIQQAVDHRRRLG